MGGAGINAEIWRRFSKLSNSMCVGTEALGNMACFGKTRNPDPQGGVVEGEAGGIDGAELLEVLHFR